MDKLIRFTGLVLISSGFLLLGHVTQTQAKTNPSLKTPPPINPKVASSVKAVVESKPMSTPLPPSKIELTKSNYTKREETKPEVTPNKAVKTRKTKSTPETKNVTKTKSGDKAAMSKGSGTSKNVSPISNNYCSCVTFAKAKSGINVGPIGVARNHPINKQDPDIGAIVVLREGPVGHVAVVTHETSTHITIDEANYQPCKRSSRVLDKNYTNIRGFYK
jgi:surface antigen